MRTTRLIGLSAALYMMSATAPALAAVGYVVPDEGFVSSKSRADVHRELIAANADGTAASKKIDGIESNYRRPPGAPSYSKLTRREVVDALIRDRALHPASRPGVPGEPYFGD